MTGDPTIGDGGLRVRKCWVFILVAPLLLIAMSRFSVLSFSKNYRLELTKLTDKHEEYVFVTELDDREFKRLEENLTQEILVYKIQARRDFAMKIGYRKEIYGEENYNLHPDRQLRS